MANVLAKTPHSYIRPFLVAKRPITIADFQHRPSLAAPHPHPTVINGKLSGKDSSLSIAVIYSGGLSLGKMTY